MTDETMTIREMSLAFDVTARTLRFYETKELLFPIRVGQRRLYTKRDQARMKLIVQGKRFGFSLEEIRQLLNLYDEDPSGTKQMNETYRIATIRLEQLMRDRDELEQMIAELRDQMDWAAEHLNAGQPHSFASCTRPSA